jgi:hypothetical protein
MTRSTVLNATRNVAAQSAIALVASLSIATLVAAQGAPSQCTAQSSVGNGSVAQGAADVCQKLNDVFSFLSPQIGVALSGGNPMLGEGGTLGGPGKFSVSVHGTVVDGRVPNNSVPISLGSTTVSSNFGGQRAPIPMPAVDAAIGLTPGYPVGLTNVGGIDLLVGLTYMPTVNRDRFAINTKGSPLAVAYGVRVGILQESALVPGVSVSYKRRKLPKTSLLYTTGDDTLGVRDIDLTSSQLRLVAAKRFVFVGIGAGIGRDQINSETAFDATVNESGTRSTVTTSTGIRSVSRSTAFVDLSFGIPKAQITIEGGWSSKGDITSTVNTFGGHSANEGYRYGSIGFGFRL